MPLDDGELDAPLLVQLARIRWRLAALDEWRRDVEHALGAVEARLQDIVKAEEIASAVADKLDERRDETMTVGTFHMTRVQTRVATGGFLLAVAIAVAGGIRALVGA